MASSAGIAHVGITVSDLEQSLEFWCGVVGLGVEFRDHLEGSFVEQVTGVHGSVADVVMLRAGHEQRIELVRYLAPADRTTVRPRPCDVGSVHVALVVDDVAAVCQRSDRLGWHPANSPRLVPAGPLAGTKVAYIFGPDGTTVELFEGTGPSGPGDTCLHREQ